MGLAEVGFLCPLHGSFDRQKRAFDRALLIEHTAYYRALSRLRRAWRCWLPLPVIRLFSYSALFVEFAGVFIGLSG